MDLTKQQYVGVVGAILLMLGVFLPVISVPVVGSISLFGSGRVDGYILLAMAIISLILILIDNLKFLRVGSVVSLLLICASFISTIYKIKSTKSELGEKLKDNPFGGMAESMMDMIQIQYGWVFLFLGGVILTYVSFSKKDKMFLKNTEINDQPSEKNAQFKNKTKLVSNDGLAYHSGYRTKFDENGVEQKNCPDCRELIRFDARKCKHCGSIVTQET